MLDRAFWRDHLRRHPLDQPAARRRPFAGAGRGGAGLASAAELFEALVRAADLERAGRRSQLRLYLGDRAMVWRQTRDQLGDRYVELLPRAADGALAGYAARLARAGHECFAVMLNESQQVLPELWLRVRDFVRGLYDETGFPLGGADANIFAGNYRRTPFGVHTDTRDVFTWIVEGEKTFLIWPGADGGDGGGGADGARRAGRAGSVAAPRLELAADRARAQVLRGGPGDLLYWPKSYWHVAETAEPEQPAEPGAARRGRRRPAAARAAALTSTLSIGIDHQLDGDAWIREALAEPAPPPPRAGATHHALDAAAIARSVRALPPSLAHAIADHRARGADPRVDRQLRLRWLCWLSGYGILPPPEAEPEPLAGGDRVRGERGYPIRCVVWRDSLLCAANGHGFIAPRRAMIARLIDALNADRVWRVDELCRVVSGRAPREHVLDVLAALQAFRAVHRIL